MYKCLECHGTFCNYCLIDEQKKVLLGLVDENFDPNDIADQPVVFGSDSIGDSHVIQELLVSKPRAEEVSDKNSHTKQLVRDSFGKYADQYNLFGKWSLPLDFFTMQQDWVLQNYKVEPFDYL